MSQKEGIGSLESQLPQDLAARIKRCGVVAVLIVDETSRAVPLAKALSDGGIDALELALQTPAAFSALAAIRDAVPAMIAGVGTVLTPDQVREAAAAGAAFATAPGLNPRVVRAAQEIGLPFGPGVSTASDIEAALELGCRELRFFPAESLGGIAYLRNLAAPYAHLGIRFLPLGGLNPENAGAYLTDPLVLAIGGTWIAPRVLIREGHWTAIRKSADEARSIVEEVRRTGARR